MAQALDHCVINALVSGQDNRGASWKVINLLMHYKL